MKNVLEIAVDNVESALAAQKGGADRIELCSALSEGGLTPSAGMIKIIKETLNINICVLIRPRAGDFNYLKEEIAIMKADIELAKHYQANGVVLGALLRNAQLDGKTMTELIKLAKPMQIILHRAFDVAKNPLSVIQQAIDLGIDRILTSGQQKKAIDGIRFIENFLKIADNKIEIMPGSGLDPTNVRQFMKIGIQNFHMSLGKATKSKMNYINPHVSMGKNTDEYTIKTADLSKIIEVRNILDNNT